MREAELNLMDLSYRDVSNDFSAELEPSQTSVSVGPIMSNLPDTCLIDRPSFDHLRMIDTGFVGLGGLV